MKFYFAEPLPLVPKARRVYERNIGGGILQFESSRRGDESALAHPDRNRRSHDDEPEDY